MDGTNHSSKVHPCGLGTVLTLVACFQIVITSGYQEAKLEDIRQSDRCNLIDVLIWRGASIVGAVGLAFSDPFSSVPDTKVLSRLSIAYSVAS